MWSFCCLSVSVLVCEFVHWFDYASTHPASYSPTQAICSLAHLLTHVLSCSLVRSFIWVGPFIYLSWSVHLSELVRSFIWVGPFIYLSWSVHLSELVRSFIWLGPFIYLSWSVHFSELVRSFIWVGPLIYLIVHSFARMLCVVNAASTNDMYCTCV